MASKRDDLRLRNVTRMSGPQWRVTLPHPSRPVSPGYDHHSHSRTATVRLSTTRHTQALKEGTCSRNIQVDFVFFLSRFRLQLPSPLHQLFDLVPLHTNHPSLVQPVHDTICVRQIIGRLQAFREGHANEMWLSTLSPVPQVVHFPQK